MKCPLCDSEISDISKFEIARRKVITDLVHPLPVPVSEVLRDLEKYDTFSDDVNPDDRAYSD